MNGVSRHLEADLQELGPLGGVVLQGLLQHGLEGLPLAVGVVAQEAEDGVQIIHTILDGGPTQTPAPASLCETQQPRFLTCTAQQQVCPKCGARLVTRSQCSLQHSLL